MQGNGLVAAAAFLIYSSAHLLFLVSSSPVQDPLLVVQNVNRRISNASFIGRKLLKSNPSASGCTTGNPIDDCWRCGDWPSDRGRLAMCAIGFGAHAMGGIHGAGDPYVVTDGGDNSQEPVQGTLRHAVIQEGPMWIIFERDMKIVLEDELVMAQPHKTIDGRGAKVEIADGGCLNIHSTSNIIVHGINFNDCKKKGDSEIAIAPGKKGYYTTSDGDAIQVYDSHDIWIDHCSFSNAVDGLLDVIQGSTAVTISNNYFTNHNKVMLLGASDDYEGDKDMQVTVALNHFGQGLIQRMPRCRHGFFHVANNLYSDGWGECAIGGSAAPTILSQGNVFKATGNTNVTCRENAVKDEWKTWNWRTEGDLMLGGALFESSGVDSTSPYVKADTKDTRDCRLVSQITAAAGATAA